MLVALGANLFVATLALAVAVFLLTWPIDSSAGRPLLILGEEHLQAEAARAGLDEGRSAPGFTVSDTSLGLTDLAGRPIDLADMSGKPVWIIFWATYCHACQDEEPDLRQAYARYRDNDLVLLAVDVGEPAEDVRRYVEERRLPWRIALDPDRRTVEAYGAIGTPTHYFVDRDGRIISRAFGRLELDEMEAHLAGIVDPEP